MSEINFHDWRLDTGNGSVMEIRHNFTISEELCKHKLLNIGEMFEKELQKYNIGMMSGNKQSAMLEKTNMLREKFRQPNLQSALIEDDLTMQAHDPGGFGQGRTIYEHTNYLRKCVDQEILVSSDAKADLDMHSLNLHEEEMHTMFKTDVQEARIEEIVESEPVEDDLFPDELPEQVFLSRVVQKPKMSYPIMSDSGASNDVFGKGELSTRILQNYLVVHDDEERGWASKEDYHKKAAVNPNRRTKHVVVANGEVAPGKSIDEIHLGVEGRQWDYTRDDWSEGKQTVFLRLQNATVCEKLTSSVFSEGNFLRNQPGWTIISHGEEKYMVYGRLEMKFHEINGQAPVRIDMKAAHGGHFLDVVTAVTDLEQVRGRDEQVEWVRADGNQDSSCCDSPAKCSMVRVEERQVTETSTDTSDLVEYNDYEVVRKVTTEDRYRVTCAQTEVMTDEEIKAREYESLEACIKQVKRVTEDLNSTESERKEAFRRMEHKMDDVDRYRRFLTAQQQDVVRCMGIQTRSARKKEENVATDGKKTETAVENADKDSIYQEYDKEFQASERTKRRVRFEDFIQSTGERKMISEHIASATRKEIQVDKQKEKSAKAVKEAERRGVTRAEREDRIAKEIQEQQHESGKIEATVTTKANIQVYKENEFSTTAAIQDVSDYTLASFLMENKVPL
jgi:hypothetical protein